MATTSFDAAYEGVPPWDIGRPQREIARLVEEGRISGSVLDVGCGTGEHALLLSQRGHEVWGLDASPRAIRKAKRKRDQRGVACTFIVGDALDLAQFKRTFDAVIDCGLFHVFSDAERPRFAVSLAGVLRPGGVYHVLCFSEEEPTAWGGPRRVTQREIRETFDAGWRIDEIRPAVFETTIHPHGGKAWLASITRL